MRKTAGLMLTVFLLSVQLVWAQNKTVIGKVTDGKDGSPIPGASVTVKGSRSGTTTGSDGTFTLLVPEKVKH